MWQEMMFGEGGALGGSGLDIHFIDSITHRSIIFEAYYKGCFILSAQLCYSDLDLTFVWIIFVFPPNLLYFLVSVHFYPVEYWLPSISVKLN